MLEILLRPLMGGDVAAYGDDEPCTAIVAVIPDK